MASNHVQNLNQNGNLFNEGGHEPYNNYTSVFSNESAYDTTWPVDPSLPDPSQSFQHEPTTRPASVSSAYQQQAWHQKATPITTASSTPVQLQPNYAAPRAYYTPHQASNNTTSFHNVSPYASHDPSQYNQSIDPSLVGPAPPDNRNFGQSLYSSTSTPTLATVFPSNGAFHNVRNAPSPNNPMAIQASRIIHSPSASASSYAQIPQAPKGQIKGGFTTTDLETLSQATDSVRLHNFLNISSKQVELPISKSALPPYVARKSRNQLKAMAVLDPTLRNKIAKRVKLYSTTRGPSRFTGALNVNRTFMGINGPSTLLSSESNTSDFDSDSDFDSEFEMADPSPLPDTRPQEPLGAVRYDTIKALWLPRTVFAESESIRSGIAEFWEVAKTIRDRWRMDGDAVKAARAAKKVGELPLLQERVDKQRDMLQTALKAAIEHGHPDVMRALGNIKPLMVLTNSFLVERINAGDYDSEFLQTLLKFLSLCTALNTSTIAAAGLNKVFARFAKRGGVEPKALSTQIIENAAKESKKAELDATNNADPKRPGVKSGGPAAKNQNKTEAKKAAQPGGSIQRTRAPEAASNPTAKRVASPASAANLATSKAGLSKKPPSAGSTGNASVTAGAVKPKTHPVVSKPPTNFFKGLQSASKKKPKEAASTDGGEPGAQAKKAVAPPLPPTFSFAGMMANLTKPQEPQSSTPEVRLPPETAEEKANRLRKEERRKLRVTWKPDATLVEVKLFSRDPSEIPGNTTNVRDAREGQEKEGLMFKQHMEMMDIDEEDDQPMEQAFFEFKQPSLIDFGHIGEDVQAMNYEPYGGGCKKVESPESLVQDNREASTLMVHYMVKSDIPPCPREPADPYTGEHLETTMFGAPDNPETLRRLAKLAPQAAPVPDVSAILASLSSFLPQAQPQQPIQDPNAALQALLGQASGNPPQYATVQPQISATPAAPAVASAEPNSLEALLAALQPQQPPLQPPFTTPPVGNPSMDPNALLAALVGQPPAQPYAAYNVGQDEFDQSERKRYREEEYEPSVQYPGSGSGNDQNKRPKWNNKEPPKFIFTCTFWKQGKCKKGANCTFKHTDD